MKKRILIAGIHGFLGGALDCFLKNNYPSWDVYGICRHPHGRNKKVLLCDLNDSKKLTKILLQLNPDYIFNLAGGRVQNQDELFSSNFLGTLSLLKVLAEQKRIRGRVIIPGTAAEYGIPGQKQGRMDEKSLFQPKSWYGVVKVMQVNLSLFYARHGLDIVVARMFNIFGERVPETLAIGKFAQEIVMIEKGIKKPIIATKNLDGQRDFLDVKDVCRAMVLAAQEGRRGETYNICSGKAYTIRALLNELINLAHLKNIRVDEDKKSSSESFNVIGSNRKFKQLTGWAPAISMRQSLKETLEYYRMVL